MHETSNAQATDRRRRRRRHSRHGHDAVATAAAGATAAKYQVWGLRVGVFRRAEQTMEEPRDWVRKKKYLT
jgi:hypothetical protein